MSQKTITNPKIKKKKIEFQKKDYDLFKSIQKYGSINKAAEKLDKSYSNSQKRIKKLQREFGNLIETRRGGKSGGGSRLTEKAKKIINRYEELQTEYQKVNQVNITKWTGKVKKIKTSICIVATSVGEIKAAITDEIERGDRVKVLIREDAVTIKKHQNTDPKTTSARNRFKGIIKNITEYEDIVKLKIKVENKKITTTITKESKEKMSLSKDDLIEISFKAMATKTLKI
ncbi:hypothetical protein C9439_01450 [archaeon SCG-AAA382B04]|nr:hypothetical protein C9439_01450 [archaeon SCG-AAA382B04]